MGKILERDGTRPYVYNISHYFLYDKEFSPEKFTELISWLPEYTYTIKMIYQSFVMDTFRTYLGLTNVTASNTGSCMGLLHRTQ